jgi:CheY-like chemotaxis protein
MPGRIDRPMDVLLVEDSPGDVRLTQEAFRDVNPAIQLHVVSDGVEAMAFLRQQGAHANAPRPDLILLDLNLPRMDGRTVLGQIKRDAGLKMIPIIVLSTSELDLDIRKAYQLRANAYVAKPVQFNTFDSVVRSINDFWLTRATLPPASKADEQYIDRPPDPFGRP